MTTASASCAGEGAGVVAVADHDDRAPWTWRSQTQGRSTIAARRAARSAPGPSTAEVALGRGLAARSSTARPSGSGSCHACTVWAGSVAVGRY